MKKTDFTGLAPFFSPAYGVYNRIIMEIYIKNQDRYVAAQGGCSPLSLIADGDVALPFRPICCRVNNKTEDLRFPIYAPKQVEYFSDLSESGRRVYTRAL